jgi:phosphoribosyl-AMP cyclohydrolase
MNLNKIKFDEKGLIPAIAQDATTGEILMVAWMNAESIDKTIETGRMTFWSRSRKKLWTKGETSGNFLEVREAYIDCDSDTLLFKVDVKGKGAVCHEGYRSCFYRKINLTDGTFTVIMKKITD